MQAVIIAAGDGGRMYPLTARVPKPLIELHGRPLISHVLESLAVAGVDDALIVTGYRGDQVRWTLEPLEMPTMRLRFVDNEAFLLGNARSLCAAREAVDGPFVLAMADHIVEPSIPASVIAARGEHCRLAVDYCIPGDLRAAEATLARVHGNKIVELGKGLPVFDALDTGIFWCTPAIFDAITPELRDGEMSAVFTAMAARGELDAVDVTGMRWIDIDTEGDLAVAHEMLAPPDFIGPEPEPEPLAS